MLFVLQLVFFTVLCGFWWYKNDHKRYKLYPPGLPRLPIIGNMHQIMMRDTSFPAETLQKLGEEHGDVMFLKVGVTEKVLFQSHAAIHKMLTHDKTTGRTQFGFMKIRNHNKSLGLIWGYGQPWHTLRRFSLRNLREFGFGKTNSMDAFINEEIEKFMVPFEEDVNNAPNNIIRIDNTFAVTVVNVLWRMMSGKSFDYNDPQLLRLVQLNCEFFRSADNGFDVYEALPVLREWFPELSKKNLQSRVCEGMYDYGKKLLDEHRAQMAQNTADNGDKSFLDIFSEKVEKSKNDPNTDFTDEQFVMTVLDLIIGGSETSSNSLNFAVLYMILNPEIQEKVQAEINSVVPADVPIDTAMKSKLPYTHATVLEIFRYSTVVPLPAPREAVEDFYFDKYLIKKGTSLLYNVHAANFNKKTWGDPLNFRPERFLNSNGSAIEPKILENLEIFGAGKRVCIGESLAQTTIFLYFASLIRKFKLIRVAGTNPSTKPIIGITTNPHPFLVQVKERTK